MIMSTNNKNIFIVDIFLDSIRWIKSWLLKTNSDFCVENYATTLKQLKSCIFYRIRTLCLVRIYCYYSVSLSIIATGLDLGEFVIESLCINNKMNYCFEYHLSWWLSTCSLFHIIKYHKKSQPRYLENRSNVSEYVTVLALGAFGELSYWMRSENCHCHVTGDWVVSAFKASILKATPWRKI